MPSVRASSHACSVRSPLWPHPQKLVVRGSHTRPCARTAPLPVGQERACAMRAHLHAHSFSASSTYLVLIVAPCVGGRVLRHGAGRLPAPVHTRSHACVSVTPHACRAACCPLPSGRGGRGPPAPNTHARTHVLAHAALALAQHADQRAPAVPAHTCLPGCTASSSTAAPPSPHTMIDNDWLTVALHSTKCSVFANLEHCYLYLAMKLAIRLLTWAGLSSMGQCPTPACAAGDAADARVGESCNR